MAKINIIVVGGGHAGVMAATYLKSFWAEDCDVKLIYDHSKPIIGVGESLTPLFDRYIQSVGVSTKDLVQNCNATLKLGLLLKDWTHEGSIGIHGFPQNELIDETDPSLVHFDAVSAYEASQGKQIPVGFTYDTFYYTSGKIPAEDNLTFRHALHSDANLTGKYIESLWKDRINIIDGNVTQVKVKDREIQSIVLESGEEFTADLFIDATGIARVLINTLDPKWIDKSRYHPTDRAIPNPVFMDQDIIPSCTTGHASKDGWIFDVGLQNRRGTGYVYSSQFTTDEEAKQRYNDWLVKEFNVELTSDRVIKWDQGYLDNGWIGNCVSIGLASGFIEPLESTNVHHTFTQVDQIARTLTPNRILNATRTNYNEKLKLIYEDSFNYTRMFYCGGRQDSEFWRWCNDENNIPPALLDIIELLKNDWMSFNFQTSSHLTFGADDWNILGAAVGIITPEGAKNYLERLSLTTHAEQASKNCDQRRIQLHARAVDHKTWLDRVRGEQL
jgi:tryptophan halogenase